MLKQADLFLFLGQSNMAGRGATCGRFPSPAPSPEPGAGFEYRAVSDPDVLHVLQEPFGVEENRKDGINDCWGGVRAKTGGLATAFANAYHCISKTAVVGVSASKGGSAISEWIPGGRYHEDMISRLDSAVRFLISNGCSIRHVFTLFCQGETDGDIGTTGQEYCNRMLELLDALKAHGVEKMFVILIGKCNIRGQEGRYDEIREAQRSLAEREEDIIVVNDSFQSFLEKGLMKDEFHYYQEGYNIAGRLAGESCASYVLGLEEQHGIQLDRTLLKNQI